MNFRMAHTALVLILGAMAGCGGGGTEGSPPAAAQSAPAQPEAAPAPAFNKVETVVSRASVSAQDSQPQARRRDTPAPSIVSLDAMPAQRRPADPNAPPVPGAPRQTGLGRDIAQTASITGTLARLKWSGTLAGGQAASISFLSADATGVRLGLRVTRLPAQAMLRFYAQGSPTAYEVSGKDVLASIQRNAQAGETGEAGRTYWAPHIEGVEATMEIELPAGTDPADVQLSVPRLSHFFNSPTAQANDTIAKIGSSSYCEVDVTCYSYTAESNAVAKLSFVGSDGGSYTCSGTLLNDRNSTGTPYLLSANHCISTQASASTLQTYWLYRSASCNSSVFNPTYRILLGGATLLYASTSTDTSFMRLNETPPAGTAFAGWSPAAQAVTTEVAGIHHPRGDLQKITFGSVLAFANCVARRATSDVFRCTADTQADSKFLNIRFSSGTTEGGSSGSAIFQTIGSNRYVVGQLYGGDSSCSNPLGTNYYGRFDVAYNTALRQWLDAAAAVPSASLAARTAGNGSGRVVSSPAGIDCGTTCSATFNTGASVVLNATANAGSTFTGWSGACTGTGACTLTANGAQSVVATFAVATISLATALDNTTLAWDTGGNAPFRGQAAYSNAGGSAAQSGAIGNNQYSYLATTVFGPGVMTFDWRVSSEAGFDVFAVSVDGVLKLSWSGDSSWYTSSLDIPAGLHTIRWQYTKDSFMASGLDAGWVDHVVFTGTRATTDTDRFFSWAEASYPQLFPASSQSPRQQGTYQDYAYRYYPATGNYLAIRNGRVILHNGRNWNFLDVGPLADFVTRANAAGY